jgi:hypothetical protein
LNTDQLPPLETLLMCECESLVFPVGGKIVEMYFPKDQCCDMPGAIAVAEMCRPGVQEIRTYAGGQPDTAYFKRGGEWQVRWLRRRVKGNPEKAAIASLLV